MDKELLNAFSRVTKMLGELKASVNEIEKDTAEMQIRLESIEKEVCGHIKPIITQDSPRQR